MTVAIPPRRPTNTRRRNPPLAHTGTAALLAMLLLTGCNPSTSNDWLVGQLESDRIEITAEFAEPITAIAVREGQPVTAGSLLLQQNSERKNAQIAEANARVAQYQARLDELIRGPRREKILAAQAALEGASNERAYRTLEQKRLTTLHKQKLVSTEQLDQAQTAMRTADASVATLTAQLEELLNGTTAEELTQAKQILAQAQAQLTQLTIDQQRLSSRAPSDGIVDSLPFQTGERPQAGQPIVILVPDEQPYARVYIPETRRAGVEVGATVKIHLDGFTQAIDGRVRFIATDAAFTPYFALTEKDRGKLTYLAKIDLNYSEHRLPNGMPVQVELLK